MQERDRELIADLRKAITKTEQFIKSAESGELGELKIAEGLSVLMRIYWDTAEELSGRASALFATHPWSSLAQAGPARPPDG
jgi:hypothetical protein